MLVVVFSVATSTFALISHALKTYSVLATLSFAERTETVSSTMSDRATTDHMPHSQHLRTKIDDSDISSFVEQGLKTTNKTKELISY